MVWKELWDTASDTKKLPFCPTWERIRFTCLVLFHNCQWHLPQPALERQPCVTKTYTYLFQAFKLISLPQGNSDTCMEFSLFLHRCAHFLDNARCKACSCYPQTMQESTFFMADRWFGFIALSLEWYKHHASFSVDQLAGTSTVFS